MRCAIFNRYFFIAIICFSFHSCGDISAYKKKISGSYYLLQSEMEPGLHISYKISDNSFIGRIPADVKEYCIVKDSLLIAKVQSDSNVKVYVLNMKADDGYVDQNIYLVDIFDTTSFELWRKKNTLRVDFIKVKQ